MSWFFFLRDARATAPAALKDGCGGAGSGDELAQAGSTTFSPYQNWVRLRKLNV